MHLALLYLDGRDNFTTPTKYLKLQENRHQHFTHLLQQPDISICIVQRASFEETYSRDNITYYFVRDEYQSTLRWWQEPASSFELLADIKPDLIQIAGFNLPLNFRWLRRIIGESIKIIGTHTGEDIWANRNIWLQQFGLRVVDGFIFQKKADTEPWIRTSVILPRQPIFILDAYGGETQKEEEKLRDIYREILL